MMIRFPCHACGAKLKASFSDEGRQSKCKCGATVNIPFLPPPRSSEQIIASQLPPTLPIFPGDEEPASFQIETQLSQRPIPSRPLRPGDQWGLIGMVFGVIGIISSLFGCFALIVSVPTSLMAIIFGSLGLRREGRGMAIAGLVMGIIGITVTVLWLGVAASSLRKFS